MHKISFEDLLSSIKSLHSQGKDAVAVTLVKQAGSSPQDVGAKAVISLDGIEFGTVGGGKVEARAILEAQKMIREKTHHLYADWNLQKDIGMTCGGVVSFFFEFFEKSHPFYIAVFGAGHISQELTRLLVNLDCHVTCFDSRGDWIAKLPASPKLRTVCTEKMADEVAKLPNNSYVAIMTMGHGTDLPILIEVMKQRDRFNYVGNVGSDQKRLRLVSDLKEAGLPNEKLNQFFCPMGEKFGTNSPTEIAFSIVAQILRTRDEVLCL